MTLSGRPLLDNRADAELFVGREDELAQLVSAIRNGFNVLVTGDPGSGKTSLLRALMYRVRSGDAGLPLELPVEFVRAEGAESADELLDRMEGQLDVEALLGLSEPSEESGRSDGVQPVILLDDVGAAAGHGLFGRLRDDIWQSGYTWIASTRSETELTMPPADAFFERRVSVGPLDDAGVRELLARRGFTPPDSWPAELVRKVGGNPRRLLSLARDASEHTGASLDATVARDEAVRTLGRSATMLAAELEALGPVSASEDRLLSRLGWTRPRAVQVFGELEQAGLVAAEDVRGERGRPRRVYSLIPPAQYLASRAAHR